MKVARVCHPLSETSILIVIDCDRIWRIRFALRRGDDTTFDPVMYDPEAHAVSLANFADTERSSGKRRARNAMLVADPTYHANREGLPGRALQTIAIEQGDDLFIIMSVCQSAYFVNKRVWITQLFSAVRRRTRLKRFDRTTLPMNLYSQPLWLRALEDGDIADQQAKHALAVSGSGRRRAPESRKVSPELQDLPLLVSCDATQRLMLEVGQLALQLG